MVFILSFDIGIKNMAYCLISVNDNQITYHKLNNINLNLSKKCNVQNIIDNTIEFLDNLINNEFNNLFNNHKLIVLIETQMTSIMKCIQTTINTFFKLIHKYESLNITTINLSPKFKLSLIPNRPHSGDYKKNKIDSINLTHSLLLNKYNNDVFIEVFNTIKKKDDISDAFLMVIYYYENFILK